MPRLDISRALELIGSLRAELQALTSDEDTHPAQREALLDALGSLEQVKKDVQDAAPAHGEHPGDKVEKPVSHPGLPAGLS